MAELSSRDCQLLDVATAPDLAGVEAVAAANCLSVNQPKISRYVLCRRLGLKKPRELRMMLVAACLARENSLRKQALAPQSDEAF